MKSTYEAKVQSTGQSLIINMNNSYLVTFQKCFPYSFIVLRVNP
jgi:hypothetical protein